MLTGSDKYLTQSPHSPPYPLAMGNYTISHFRRLLHWGPILALTVIGVISIMGITCNLQWWPVTTVGGLINMGVFLFWNVTVLYNFFNAAFLGPGHVPLGWVPKEESAKECLQWCAVCKGYKAPRSHHCRKCGRCVMKMDHHCPWINNCVGHINHGYFTYFLFFAPLGCIHAISVLIPSMYRALNRHYYIYYGTGDEPIVNLDMNQFIACMFSVGLAIGVIIAVGGLFYIQIRTILKNETGIESWIIEKAHYREREEGEPEFKFPYNLGRKENFRIIFTWHPDPRMDGMWWPVIDGCHQYTLTVEQMKQKKEKQERSVVYEIRESYSGHICPCSKGCRVGCCPPITDEPRIKLEIGERVLVSRWKKRWLYGDKLIDKSDAPSGDRNSETCDYVVAMKGGYRVRGWFPRQCAVEVIDNSTNVLSEEKKTETEKKTE